MQNPSWKWMSSRPTAQELAEGAAASKAKTRPCLPVVEQLGDRVMLSADTEVIVNPDATVKLAVDQILIGLIKGELQETSTELSLLKIVADADPKLANKFTSSLLKIDDILYKQTEVLIKGESKDAKHLTAALADLQDEFVKLDTLIDGFPKLGDIKLVLDDMQNKAESFLLALSKIEVVDELTDKERQTFLKISDAFGDLDAGLLKLQEDLVTSKHAATGKHIQKGQLQYLEVKLNDILVTSRSLGDEAGTLKGVVLGSLKEYETILNRLLLPAVDDKDVITIE